MRNLLHKRHLILIYNSYLKSLLDYCSPLFVGAPNCYVKPIWNLQKKAIRIINRAEYRAHTRNLFIELRILPFKKMIIYNSLRFMFQYKNKKAPVTFDNMWKLKREVRQRVLRNDEDFHVEFTNKHFLKSLPLFKFPTLWNELPDDLKIINNWNEFCRKVFNHLLLADDWITFSYIELEWD